MWKQQRAKARLKSAASGAERNDARLPDGRGAYTFCMCPGGTVVPAASRLGGVCVNGGAFTMSGGTVSDNTS